MNKTVEIKKIPLEVFIETLVTMYNSGVEYVNMTVEKGEKQDSIWIAGDDNNVNIQPEKKEVISNIDLEDLA
jgi:hypothetical protein